MQKCELIVFYRRQEAENSHGGRSRYGGCHGYGLKFFWPKEVSEKKEVSTKMRINSILQKIGNWKFTRR